MAEKLYQPKGYTNEDLMRSIVMLRLGRARVAEFAHHSLSLPSITTTRRNTVLQPLIVSLSVPTGAEIEENITLCYSSLGGTDNNILNTCATSVGLVQGLVHQVLMLDELAIEQRIHWDDSTNKFLGVCCEHGYEVPLDFTSEQELDILCNAITNDKLHLASEATVAGLGALSEIPCQYSV